MTFAGLDRWITPEIERESARFWADAEAAPEPTETVDEILDRHLREAAEQLAAANTAPFEVDGIVYDPRTVIDLEPVTIRPMFSLIDEDCTCHEGDACLAGRGARWTPEEVAP